MQLRSSFILHLLWFQCAQGLVAAPNSRRDITAFVKPQGFKKFLFYDDFTDRPVGGLPASWMWNIAAGTRDAGGPAHWGTGELETYTSHSPNIAITSDHKLRITPIRGHDGTWTSARLESKAPWDFCAEPGTRLRIEAKIKLGANAPSSQLGIWPAFWALGAAYRGNYTNWPGIGEIDILESVNGESQARHVVHCGVTPGGPCRESTGIASAPNMFQRGVWHTLAWEVDRRAGSALAEETMSWFVDGQVRWTLKESDVGNAAAWSAMAGDKKMLLLNVAVGGSLPDAIAGQKTPTRETLGGQGSAMEVDYVAVFA